MGNPRTCPKAPVLATYGIRATMRSIRRTDTISSQDRGHFLPEQATAVALLDRLLHHAVVVVTAGESYRMREARTRGGGGPIPLA